MRNLGIILKTVVGLFLMFSANIVLAKKVSLSVGKSSTYDVFSDKPWPNETPEMFNDRRQLVISCSGKQNPQRSDFTSEEYSDFYDCWIKGVTNSGYPLNETTKKELAPEPKKKDTETPAAQFAVEYQCGNPDKGYMIELGNLDNIRSKLIFDSRVFKDGQLINSKQIVSFGNGSSRTKTLGKKAKNESYSDVGFFTDNGVKKSRILVSDEGVRIELDGTDLSCVKYNSTSSSSSSGANQ